MENSAPETDTGHGQEPGKGPAHSPAAGPEAGVGQAWRRASPLQHAGKGASCWLPSHSLPPALWLAEGRFHHRPAPQWLLRARRPRQQCVHWPFYSQHSDPLTSGVTFLPGRIRKVNLCIIPGLLLPYRTAATEVLTSAKCPWKFLHTLDKHLACLTKNKTT